MIVVDTGVLVVALADDGADGRRARERLRGQTLAAPDLIDLEVSSVLRRFLLGGSLSSVRAEQALADLMDLPLHRASHGPLIPRCWALRQNLTIYDASYVALAEELDAVLLTTDARLSRAPRLRCKMEVLQGA
ncbi:type II toxin-antitoxin system VapC family toxin [Arthrobacter sp. H41]|uniref:type II toxin-antitoxin system VapC family toxin n=1 Tax=Arthrobacter sp. H41 TaxID=1312978 RepID=UPI00047E5EB7|nr:type II toxin-antitoxin system VapC family toxin [Arthrobacter sp. H41]